MTEKIKKIWTRARLPLILAQDKILKIYKPRVVVLVVNNSCNMHCKYCFGEYYKRSASDDFTTAQLLSLIDDLHRNGTVYITVHGGETLLRKDIGIVVEHIKRLGMCINLITNGTLLPKKINEIKKVDGICISLDGREENNDINRGKGAYKIAVNAIRLVKEKKIPIRVSATLTRHTMNDITFLAELAKDLKFHLYFSILFPTTPEITTLCMDNSQTRTALHTIIELKRKKYPIFTSFEALKLALDWPYEYTRSTLRSQDLVGGMHPIPCCYTRHKFTIDADGRAYPCFPLMGNFDALNVKEVGVKKAFDHVMKHTECVLCPFISQNDWSFMMCLKPKHVLQQIPLHLREIFGQY